MIREVQWVRGYMLSIIASKSLSHSFFMSPCVPLSWAWSKTDDVHCKVVHKTKKEWIRWLTCLGVVEVEEWVEALGMADIRWWFDIFYSTRQFVLVTWGLISATLPISHTVCPVDLRSRAQALNSRSVGPGRAITRQYIHHGALCCHQWSVRHRIKYYFQSEGFWW